MSEDQTTKGRGRQYMKGQATSSIVTASVISNCNRYGGTTDGKTLCQRTDKFRCSMELLLLYFSCSLFLDSCSASSRLGPSYQSSIAKHQGTERVKEPREARAWRQASQAFGAGTRLEEFATRNAIYVGF